MSYKQRRISILFTLSVLGLLVAMPVFAGGTQEIPEAEVKSSGTQYISPNDDGVQDTGTIEFEVTVYVRSREGYIPEYGLQISDEDGRVVRRVVQQESSDVGWLLRLFRSFQAFTLEKSLSWDGTNDQGEIVDDGRYDVTMWVVSGSNQRIELDLDGFVVDTQPPSVVVEPAEPKLLSPDNDGQLETYTIRQRNGTVEDRWEARITDSRGATVRTYTWTETAPDDVVWDGTDAAGSLVADGTFEYHISSTDRAGNSFSHTVTDIVLDTTETPISLSVEPRFISPNDDGVQDVAYIRPSQEVEEGIVEWTLSVHDRDGNAVRTYGAESPDPPDSIVFDGKNDAGETLAHGSYNVVYRLRYFHGNRPTTSQPLVVDLVDPHVAVQVTERYISPDGDGRQDETRITFRADEPVTWTGRIEDEQGNVVLETTSEQTTSLIVWDGTGPDGEVVDEGRYTLTATFTDRAGNTYTPPPETVTVDVTEPEVSLEFNRTYFSPDGDGVKDTVTATLTANEPVRGVLELRDRAGRDYGSVGGFGRAAQVFEGTHEFTWGGISGSGLILPDGTYVVAATLQDLAGNRVSLDPVELTIDTRPVSVRVNAPKGFAPNDNGRFDVLKLDVTANFYDTVEYWKVAFVDGSGRTMQVKEGSETLPRTIEWDGSMQFVDDDIKAPEGLYFAELELLYRKGNLVEARSNSFFIDVTPPAVSLHATANPFARTDGEMDGELFITLRIDDAHEVSDWSLDIVTPENEIVRSFTGRGDLTDQLIWREEEQTLEGVPHSDRVLLRVSVVDEVGNEAEFEQEVPVDLILVRRDGKLYLMVDNIIFGAYQYELDSRGPEMYERNLRSLGRVVEIYERYPVHTLLLEGHALNIYRGNEEAAMEEEQVLDPLTENRAVTVRDALIDRGLSSERIRIEWFGGRLPIVDVHDREIRWKNRRVEFIMEKQDRD